MKILLLTSGKSNILEFLKQYGEVTVYREKLDLIDSISYFDWIISYGYRHIIKASQIKQARNPIINLHISYLPYNRGADPNFWSWYEGTPKGVSIHQIDEGIDTGPIYARETVEFTQEETLASSYDKLKNAIENLFYESFEDIVNGKLFPYTPSVKGTFHLNKDLDKHKSLLYNGWNTPVKDLKKMTDLEIINEIESVRSKNNVNWMDILRLAFKHAPDQAREIVGRINADDNKISSLLEKLSNNK
jgi:methionyl-tRNA formyltransferase